MAAVLLGLARAEFNYGPASLPLDLAALHREADAILSKYADYEGHTGDANSERQRCLRSLGSSLPAAGATVHNMAEIGFNSGHGAATLLATFPDAHLCESPPLTSRVRLTSCSPACPYR